MLTNKLFSADFFSGLKIRNDLELLRNSHIHMEKLNEIDYYVFRQQNSQYNDGLNKLYIYTNE